MDSRQSLVVSARISSDLSERLREELKKNPDAVSNLRNIAGRALQNGRTDDAFLIGLEARAMQKMAKKERIKL